MAFSRFPTNAAWIKPHLALPGTAKAGYLTSQPPKTGPACGLRERETGRQMQVIKMNEGEKNEEKQTMRLESQSKKEASPTTSLGQ